MTAPDPALDHIFSALADPTRRAILARLGEGEANVNDLVAPFGLSQPAISKHIKVLEQAGLVTRGREAQRRPVRLNAARLAEASRWIDAFERFWTESYDQLDAYLQTMKEEQK